MQRKPLYEEADLHLQVGDESPQKVAKQILQALPSIMNEPEAPNAPQTTVG